MGSKDEQNTVKHRTCISEKHCEFWENLRTFCRQEKKSGSRPVSAYINFWPEKLITVNFINKQNTVQTRTINNQSDVLEKHKNVL